MEKTPSPKTCGLGNTSPLWTSKAADVEAPKDEWGFPSVAGRLSQCCGASAPHCDVDQRGQPHGLIDKLLKVDVAEAYAPPRVTLEAKKFGLKPGEAWDLTNGWDFTRQDHRDKAE